MKTRTSIMLATLLLALIVSGCGSDVRAVDEKAAASKPSAAIDAITNQVTQGVGAVGHVAKQGSGAPVLVFEELHNSRAGQVQQAIMLVRLYEKHGLRDIALEGYLKERPKMNPVWFTKAAPGTKAADRARVAVRLLKEGEISAAEFMKLSFDDVNVHPAEDAASYNATFSPGALDAMLELAAKIDASLAREVESKLESAIKVKPLTTKEQLDMAEDLESRRTRQSIVLPASKLKEWRSWLDFWRARAKADPMMVDVALSASSNPSIQVAAMVIGAAHTAEVSKLLGQAGRPYAVIASQVLKDKDTRGDLDETYERKSKRQSVFSEGLLAQRVNAFSDIKPEPATAKPEPWIEGKAAIYRSVDAVANAALGPPQPPNNGKPPFGLGNGDFGSRFVRPLIASAEIIDDDDNPGKRAVVFPIVLNPDAPAKRSTLWVKAVLAQSAESGVTAVEDMLKQALGEIQAEAGDSKRTEDAAGRVRVSTTVTAGFAGTKAAARALRIGS